MRHLIGICLLSGLLPSLTYAGFEYNNKPISPDCLVKLVEVSDNAHTTAKLATCSSAKAAKKVHLAQGVYTTKDESSDRIQSFADYSIIGESDNKFLLDFGQWTGGSGFFTSILWVEKTDTEIKLLKALAGGDRCNGGTEKTGPWSYSINLTSADLIDAAEDKSIKINAYRDLDASAAGCVAKSHYKFDPVNASESFLYVVLDKRVEIDKAWASQFTYQACLDRLLTSYNDQKLGKLDLKGLKTFAEKFKGECMR